MITAIAIDDEPLPLEILEKYCGKTDFIRLEKTFTKVTEAAQYLQKQPVDLLFLDIQMPAISGIDFYKNIKQPMMVIFTTAYSQYAVEGFNLNAIDYILKPYDFERFEIAAKKASDFHQYLYKKEIASQQSIYVRSEYSLVNIPISDILYIESFADYLTIHYGQQKKVTTRMTMKTMLEKLPQPTFIRVHRSFIIPLKRIESVRNKVIRLPEIDITIGSSYEEDFFKDFIPK